MIEFNGQISQKNQLDRFNRVKKFETIILIITSIIIGIIGIVLGLIVDILQDSWFGILIFSIVFCGVSLLNMKTPQEIALRFRLSPHIIITKNDLSLELRENRRTVWRKRKLSKVKKILDCSEVYYIIFKFGDITNAWICQKDNIINGTIEDFENLFQSKIVRKIK